MGDLYFPINFLVPFSDWVDLVNEKHPCLVDNKGHRDASLLWPPISYQCIFKSSKALGCIRLPIHISAYFKSSTAMGSMRNATMVSTQWEQTANCIFSCAANSVLGVQHPHESVNSSAPEQNRTFTTPDCHKLLWKVRSQTSHVEAKFKGKPP